MRVLFFGDLSSYARSRQRYEALRTVCDRVLGVPSVRPELDLGGVPRRGIRERILFRLGYPPDEMGVNAALLEHIGQFRPDVLWLDKVNVLRPEVLRKAKERHPELKVAYCSEDDVYLRHNQSRYLRGCFPAFDVVFTSKPRNVSELPRLGCRNVQLFFQAYDPAVHRPMPLHDDERRLWGADVSFVGTFETERAEKIGYLARHGIDVRIWGNGWEGWARKHPNVRVEARPVYNDDYIRVLNASRINLNFLRKANRDLHTSRSVEIPACGAFMLAERTDEHLQLFAEDDEAVFFESPAELLARVKFYLEHEQHRSRIAEQGRLRCIRGGYSHEERIRQMILALLKPSKRWSHNK